MADVYEQNLPQKTNLTTNDYVRVVGSDDVSYKQPLSDVAQKTIENYAGSTLAGSTQSVKGAIDGLKSSAIADKAELNASINEVASDLASESSTRASQDTNLQEQINQFVAPTGTAPNPTEITNARVGADNVTYTTLGDAIRTQVSDLKSELSVVVSETGTDHYINEWVQGGISTSDGSQYNSAYGCRSAFLSFGSEDSLTIEVDEAYTFIVFEYSSDDVSDFVQAFGTDSVPLSGSYQLQNTEGHFYRIMLVRADVHTFTPSSISSTAVNYITKALSISPNVSDFVASEILDPTLDETSALGVQNKVVAKAFNVINKSIGAEESLIYEFAGGTGTIYNVEPITDQWLLSGTVFDDGVIISSLKFASALSDDTEVNVSISFFSVSNNTATRYKKESFSGTVKDGSLLINAEMITEGSTIIGFESDTAFAKTQSAPSDYSHWVKNASVNATSVDISTQLPYGIYVEVYALHTAFEVLNQEVHVGNGLEYEEIQEALDSLTSDSATIIVHPKDTPYARFSLMRKLNETYPWNGLATVKDISIIGLDKAKCIVKDDSGNYDTPPAEIATNGIIKNLTFIATHSASTGVETSGSYAVHIDNRPADTNGMRLRFENCDFVSYQASAVGLGLYQNQDISFDNCSFKSITDTSWKPNANYNSAYMCALGAYFMHTAMGYASGNMFVRFRNCVFIHEGGSYSVRLEDHDNVKTARLEAINNTLWDVDANGTNVYSSAFDLVKLPYCNGNNATEWNA